MMGINIHLHQLGKKFGREWIFRQLSTEILAGDKLVILGGNGSGKSTLLQVISGFITPNEGAISYVTAAAGAPEQNIDNDNVKDYLSLASPYLQLPEDFKAIELIDHVGHFKPYINKLGSREVLDLAELSHAGNKYIRQFSSGMKQRLRLALAILADAPVLLLDEPVSNLDKKAIQWFTHMINDYAKARTVMVCSNAIEEEYFFCNKQLQISDYKI
jgi:ABC-type multidrug transport system ATPase subunit